jgi:hypothetical protein
MSGAVKYNRLGDNRTPETSVKPRSPHIAHCAAACLIENPQRFDRVSAAGGNYAIAPLVDQPIAETYPCPAVA